jgi:hypothetical protein
MKSGGKKPKDERYKKSCGDVLEQKLGALLLAEMK